MLNEKLAQLITRKLSGEATAEELQELEVYLQNNAGEQYFVELLINYWDNGTKASNTEDFHPDEHFEHILALANEEAIIPQQQEEIPAIVPQRNYKKIFTWVSVAAVFVLAVVAVYIFNPPGAVPNTAANAPAVHKNEVTAKTGVKSQLVLPDGTKVWLNSESKLIYSSRFKDSLREVELEGEAFFDVVKDAKHPFIVHTSGIDIKVLGTAFNVKSYPRESTIEATLIRGLIEVVRKNEPSGTKVILQPHEKLIYNKLGNTMNASGAEQAKTADAAPDISISPVPKNIPDTAMAETSWIYNKLIFEGDTFRQLAVKMERWFNVQITFKNERVANYRFRGVFEKENIEQALQALQLTAPFNYTINNNEVEIYKK